MSTKNSPTTTLGPNCRAGAKYLYLTTPIYYPNANPHLGHAYTTVLGDTIHRYHQLMGDNSIFLTGTDEHGQKVAEAAAARGVSPQMHVDELSRNFQENWHRLLIEATIFMRTTTPSHISGVQSTLSRLYQQGLIYKSDYEGWYCISEEIFYTEKDLVNGMSPTGKPVTKVTESNYFFKMSQFQEQIIQYLREHTDFIIPTQRMAEVLGFLQQPLQDLCISRPKSRLSWGIELPFDHDFVCYVWFDALLNYVTALGYQAQSEHDDKFTNYWNNAVHLVGKDILTTHAIYWSAMLMALDLPLPRHIYAHGWWLNAEGKKMSKSEGETVSPQRLIETLGPDQTRYFLIRSMHAGSDASFSIENAISVINDDLADRFGNLLSRASNLAAQHFAGKLPSGTLTDARSLQLRELASETIRAVLQHARDLEPDKGLQKLNFFLDCANKYISDLAPWKLAKDEKTKPLAGETIYVSLESVRIAAVLLWPVIPQKSASVLAFFGNHDPVPTPETLVWGVLPSGLPITKAPPLFPKLQK